MENCQIKLNDNRTLRYAEYGTKKGYPIIYCHGSQSSRLEMHYDLAFAFKKNIKIISIDRPGHGESDFNPSGTIRSFANDVDQLVDKLGIGRFSVVGMSAGAPFAMGIAHYLNQRTDKLGIVSGFAPLDAESQKALTKDVRLLLKIAKSFPIFLKMLLKMQNWQLKRNPNLALSNFLRIMSSEDQDILKNERVLGVIKTMFIEAFKNGSQGVAYEISRILVQDWGFEMKEIKAVSFIWHGKKDNNVPLEWAIKTNNEIGNSKLKIYPSQGHLIFFENAEEIFTKMLAN